jgi:hypothetical protein
MPVNLLYSSYSVEIVLAKQALVSLGARALVAAGSLGGDFVLSY